MDQIKSLFYSDFTERVYSELRSEFGDEHSLDNKNFSCEVIVNLTDEAEKFDIKTEAEVYQFIQMFYAHPALQDRPYDDEILEILTWPDRAASRKFEMLKNILDG